MLLFCVVLGHYNDSLHTSTNETPGPAKSAALPLGAGRSPRQQKRCNVGIGQGDHHPYNQYDKAVGFYFGRFEPKFGQGFGPLL